MIRRINFFAGPGAGKSTMVTSIFSELKKLKFNIELVTEYVKTWAYLDRDIRSFDQVYIFGKQIHEEDRLLYSGADMVISDSPILLTSSYAKKSNTPGWEQLIEIAKKFEEQYPSINFFIDRSDKEYKTMGRYETYSQAMEMDTFILDFISKYIDSEFISVPYDEYQKTLDEVLRHI